MIKVLEQAIEKVKTLPEERQRYAAEVLEHIAADSAPVRALSARELALLEQSKADFSAGRTYSVDEVRAHTDEVINKLRAKHPTST